MGTGAYVTVADKQREGSKMNIFEKWIMRRSMMIQRKYDDSPMAEEVYATRASNKLISARGSNDLGDNRPMTFNIYRASGGSIVELRKYDNRKDHWDNQLHVIPDDADFNDTLSRIVTLETLRA
jgi:hypothetical protein